MQLIPNGVKNRTRKKQMICRFLHPTSIHAHLIIMIKNVAPKKIVLCRKPFTKNTPSKNRNFQRHLLMPNRIFCVKPCFNILTMSGKKKTWKIHFLKFIIGLKIWRISNYWVIISIFYFTRSFFRHCVFYGVNLNNKPFLVWLYSTYSLSLFLHQQYYVVCLVQSILI